MGLSGVVENGMGMADEPESSLELTGMGKLAKAIPPRAQDKLVTTASTRTRRKRRVG
jgi:hypothetical protein